MKSKTNEEALEIAIEKALTGSNREVIKQEGNDILESQERYRGGNGYYIGQPSDFNAQYAVDEVRLWDFLNNTQSLELEKIAGSDRKLKILSQFNKIVKKYGILYVLKKGLDVDNAHFTMLYVLPLVSSSDAVKENFEKNQFSVTRQVQYNLENKLEEIDMVIFLNGLPIITIELKNPWTHQTARYHGQKQYKNDRDPRQPLLQFGRCIVHMAVDTDEVYMTTKLKGKGTFFLPFNKGYNNGQGNPPNPFGHKTQYLWDEVFSRPSLANIIQHFVRLNGKKKDPLRDRILFFPRYHQLDVVRQILNHAANEGLGHTYLIQHSAGSGKSNSITWAVYQLIEVYPENEKARGSKDKESPLFDTVIVVTDRRLLDRQLRDNIKEFSEVGNIVASAHSSKELKEHLENGKRIITTTIQKFPFILDGVGDLSDRNFAVVIDEAHSSQGGIAAGKLNEVIGQNDDEEDGQDKILEAIKARKMKGNASYMAFTATPKNTTLERFGTKQKDGSFKPFHLYSMKQAIQEGFIKDVLANYTTYKSYYEIDKSVKENPLFDSVKAQKKLKAFVERNPSTIQTKAEIMLDHFMSHVVNKKRLKGKAKGMIVTQSIESAIRYFKAIQELLKDKGRPFRIIVAFSGSKIVDGMEWTEDSINDLPKQLDNAKPTDPDYISDKIARFFDMEEYRLLIVANKYLTGFDQPKLCTMYIDKKLQHVMAVQALSRLNRSADKLGKKTEDLFILDFFNTVDDMQSSFDPFYTSTTLSGATDVNVLHELLSLLGDAEVYEWSEVEGFNEKYFNGADAQFLSPYIDIAAARFNEDLSLSDEDKADFKIKAKHFVKIYGQVSSIITFEMVKWEQLFWFLKFLIPKLIIKDKEKDSLDELLNSVDLSTYGLERTRLNEKITLNDEETSFDPQNANPRGAHGNDEDKDPLDDIIKAFNERWYQGWDATPEEQRVKFISLGKHVVDHPDYEEKYKNNPDSQNREIAFKKILDDVMSDQRRKELELYKMYSRDESFMTAFMETMKRMVKE
ncbi:MAG: type I restriction enzyme R subunit [Halioglobus sp.]